MRKIVRDREIRLALGVLYTLAILFFSAVHLGGSRAIAGENGGQFAQGLQLSICYGAGDVGAAQSSGACGLCSMAASGPDPDNVAGQACTVRFVAGKIFTSFGASRFGYDYSIPPLRGPPSSIS